MKLPQMVVDDLLKSGLTLKTVGKLGYAYFDETKTKETTGTILTDSLFIPYYDLNGKYNDFYRLKLFNHDPKYYQPSNTLPQLYLPPLVDWSAIAADTTVPIHITEGEKKAACATYNGLACIGIGGVWSWKSKKASLPHLPDFKLFDWKGRSVVIVFDSDLSSNPNVLGAMHAMARLLSRFGAIPTYIKLPSLDDEKCGLDDFLVAKSVDEFKKVERFQFDEIEQLWEFNKEFAVIQDMNVIYDFAARKLCSVKDFLAVRTTNRKTEVVNSKGLLEEKYVGKIWLDWPFRREHTKLSYSPGQPPTLPDGALNTWEPSPIMPVKGPVGPWAQLLDHFFKADRDARKWFEMWCAFPLKNPGYKMFSSVLFWGNQGAGKTLLATTLGRIYGKNFSEVQRRELFSPYNEWAVNKQFILVEEATGSDKREDSDLLKHLITRLLIRVSEKYVPNYFVEDRANYFFTANHPDALFLDPSDRRFFVWQTPSEILTRTFFTTYDVWYRSEKGISALYYYLLHLDCSAFDPRAPAIKTTHKEDMQSLSASDLDLWCRDLFQHPDDILLDFGTKDLYTCDELLSVYAFQKDRGTSLIALSKALRRAGFAAPRSIKMGVKTRRLVAVKNRVIWDAKSAADWGKHYQEFFDKREQLKKPDVKKYQ